MSYELIKSYYELGLFTKSDLEIFASIGWITDAQRKELIK
ncbi:XkdX family protein [Holdemanella sp.]